MPNRPVQSNAAAEERSGERRRSEREGESRKKGLEGERVEEEARVEVMGVLVTLQQASGHTLHVKHDRTETPWESVKERWGKRRARAGEKGGKEERATLR